MDFAPCLKTWGFTFFKFLLLSLKLIYNLNGEPMEYKILGRTGLRVSRIGLGTAELGFSYGIGPRSVPTDSEADSLLKSAVDMGVNFFDTAHIHQLADERIARSGIAKIPGVIIATKCGQFLEKGEDPPKQELRTRITSEVEDNLRNLQMETLPILQLHGGTKEQIERGDVIDVLDRFKKEGKVQYAGISTRGEEAPLAAIRSGFFDVIHVAYSVLDQRMAKKVLPLALKDNIGAICRSVLLKGALTNLVSYLPDSLEPLKRNAQKARIIAANELNTDLPTLAIRFALFEQALSVVLIGTNKLENLRKAISAVRYHLLPSDVVLTLRELAIDDPAQVDPAMWKEV